MALPVITQYLTKEIVLPVSKRRVKYRAFLVADEKKLLMLKESNGTMKEVLDGMADIVDSCTFGSVKARELPIVDLEYLFIRICALSKGEITKSGYKCNAPLESGGVCGHINEVQVNLEAVEPTLPTGDDPQLRFDVPNTNIALHFQPPTFSLAYGIGDMIERLQKEGKLKPDEPIAPDVEFDLMVTNCLSMVTEGDVVFNEFSQDELITFLNGVPSQVFDEVREKFIRRLPVLSEDVQFKCAKCGHEETLHLEGSRDFF